MSNIIKDMIVNYTGVNRTAEHTWDYIQKTVRWPGFYSRLTNMFCKVTQVNWKSGSYSPRITDQAALQDFLVH